VLYIAVEQVPEFAECAAARRMVAAQGFRAELARLRATPNVDYYGVAGAKLPVLRLVYDHFVSEHLGVVRSALRPSAHGGIANLHITH
jgi:(1->4)-alpha-D-glucan 1-alpha-D-glucosylmutase